MINGQKDPARFQTDIRQNEVNKYVGRSEGGGEGQGGGSEKAGHPFQRWSLQVAADRRL